MGVSGNSISGKSFQSFTVSDDLLAKVVEAVLAGEKKARTSGTIQSFEVFYRGFRQNIAIGRIYIIPASVCNDRKDFPTALLYGCLVKEFGGEEIGDMVEKKIGESEFDEYSQADFDTIKEKLFGVGGDKFESLVLFAPCWWNKREYIAFKFSKDEAKLKNNLRHQVFAAYFDPRLSSAFNAIMTNVNTTKVDVTDITPKINFPFLAENLLTQYPTLQKQASNKKRIELTRKTADEVTKEVLDPQELDVFESLDQALSEALMPGTETVEEAGEANEGGYNAPDTEHEVPRLAGAESKELDPKKFPKKPEDDKKSAAAKVAYVAHVPGHRNSKGEAAPWVIKQHNTDKILESFKSKSEAEAGLKNMESHKHGCDQGEPPIGIAIDETGVPRSETEQKFASKWAKVAGKTIKTAKVKVTFGTNNVYFDMDGSKYMLSGADAEAFLGEWLPKYEEMKAQMEAERDAVVEQLARKYISKMQKRPEKASKPAPTKIDVAPEVSEPAPEMSMAQHASKEASADAFTPVSKKDKIHPGNLRDADVIAAIDEKKWGNATIPINFGKRQGGVPTVKSASKTASLDKFTEGYLVCALWAENDESDESGGNPLDQNYSIHDFAPEALKEAQGVCQNFQHDAAALLEEAYQRGYTPERAGHDFWLTRNGHGAGFWDRDELRKGGLGVKLSEIAHKYGDGNVYVGDDDKLYFYEPAETTPQHEMDFHASASYVASKMAKLVDYDGYEAASEKTKKARADREAKLTKNRQKQADVALDFDSIWNEITEDMGPAPEVPLPGDGGAAADGGSETKSEGSSDGRPRKSDMGKLPESMTSDEPEEEKAMSDSEAESQEDSTPEPKHEEKSEESEEKWHVSSSMDDFIKEAMAEIESVKVADDPDMEYFKDAGLEAPNEVYQCQDCGHEGPTDTHGRCAVCNSSATVSTHHVKGGSTKQADAVQPDVAEAKAEVVSPDTVDPDIHQETKSVPEAAKVADAVQPDVAEAKSEVVSPDTVDPDIHQETESVEEAAKVAAYVSHEGQCPHCDSYDTDEVDTESGKYMYCHSCDQLSTIADAKVAAAGDDMPEEIPFDFGAGDLADIVMSEDDPDGKEDSKNN